MSAFAARASTCARASRWTSTRSSPPSPATGPGDTAHLLVIAPFASGRGLLTVLANNAAQTHAFALDHGSAIVDVPITDAYTHGVTVQVDLAGQAARPRDDGTPDPSLPPRPAF